MKKKFFFTTILFLSVYVILNAQTQSNLEVINNLIDRSVTKTDSLIGGRQNIYLAITSPPILEVLKSKIIQAFSQQGYVLKSSENETAKSVSYTLTSAKVEYKNSFSDGLFGGTRFEREITLNYSIAITESDKTIHPFELTTAETDTVGLDQISGLEIKTLPFTQAPLSSQPLLSNLWEPIVVVGTLIVTIILLFSVRSK